MGVPAGFDDTDFEKARQKMVEERTTTATFTVTFSPVFDGLSSGDLTIVTAMTGGASFKLPVTAKGTGVGLKAPDAADRTMTVKYYTGTIREQANKIRRILKKKERRVSLLFLLNTVGCDQHLARFAAVLGTDVAAGFHRLDHAGGAVVADL